MANRHVIHSFHESVLIKGGAILKCEILIINASPTKMLTLVGVSEDKASWELPPCEHKGMQIA